MKKCITSLVLFAAGITLSSAQKQWTLQECIDYALTNNIQLKQNQISAASAEEDERASRAALLPSLSASTNQSITNRPFSQSTINLTNGTMTTSSNETNYNGNYGLNANWTVWNGGKNRKNVTRSRYLRQMADLQTQETANNIQEQITQLYVQILYLTEAVRVDSQIVKASQLQLDRGRDFLRVGSIAKVDVAQLEAQVAQDQYALVSAQTQVANYKLQLKQLLELHGEEDFDVAVPTVGDNTVLAPVPTKKAIYETALNLRPEVESDRLNIEASNLEVDIAKAGYQPTVSMNAGIGTNNGSGMKNDFGTQLKNNWSNSVGVTVSIPILDNRQTKSAVNKAKLAVENSQLQLQNTQKQLYSEIENYWLQATSAQQQYRAAQAQVKSAQASYDLVSEQFKQQLKNIVELTNGKNDLLQAQQNLLQCKYTALFNLAMLRFYQGEQVRL